MATRIVETSDSAQTEALGAELAAALKPGDIVLVRGELGAGKTTLVRGAAKALGVGDAVTSPTFSIGHRYQGSDVTVSHLDLYRLAALGQEEPELLDDYLTPTRSRSWSGLRRRLQSCETRVCWSTSDPRGCRSQTHRSAEARRGCAMIVLGLDTATSATVVGLRLADGRTLQGRDDPDARQRPGHTTRLLPLANDLLVEADIDWPQVERIAIGVGPGTFTGLRIGIATARGLAQSLGVELVGVSSLRALANGASQEAPRVLAAIDARRGEVFIAAYDAGQELIAPSGRLPRWDG